MIGSRLIKSNDVAAGCENIVDAYDPFGDSSGLALYQLNGNANDVSGNYNGTASNVTYGTGVFGQAGVFNGSTSVIDTPITTLPNSYTISLWFKANSMPSPWASITAFKEPNAYSAFIVLYNNGDLVFQSSENSSGYNLATGITTNNWYNIVGIKNGTTQYLYVNGSQVGVGVTTALTPTTSGNWNFGKFDTSTGLSFNGSIDQVRIFNTALTPLEVEALYTEELCICGGTVDTLDILDDSSCIALYPLDGNANDLSGNYSAEFVDNQYSVGEFDLAMVYNYNNVSSPSTGGYFYTNSLPQPTYGTSISFWAKPETTGVFAIFAGFGNDISPYNAWRLIISAEGNIGFDRTNFGVVLSNFIINYNQWNHIVFNFNNSTSGYDIYLNGVKETVVGNINLSTGSTISVFGGHQRSSIGGSGILVGGKGQLDQIRVFDKILNQGEVTTLFEETACVVQTRTAEGLQILGDSSCIANYRLDGDTTDLSGNYNASINLPNYTNGDFDFALLSTPSTVMTAPASLVGQNHSVSMWINPNSTSGTFYPYGQFVGGVSGRFFANIQNGYLGVGIDTSVDYVTTTNPLILKQWNHVVWIKDSTYGWYFYVNNILAGQVAATNNIYTGTNTTFGTYANVDGSIDQIRIFNKAVTPSEVTTLYNEGL